MRTDKETDELRRISDWPRRWLEHRYLPWHLAVLGSGSHPTEIERTDEQTLLVRPHGGGSLRRWGTPTGVARWPNSCFISFHQQRAVLTLDRLYHDNTPMKASRQIQSVGVTVKITASTDDGRPAEAAFRFTFALENPLFRWLQWKDQVYVPFELPAVGETMTLPAATVSF